MSEKIYTPRIAESPDEIVEVFCHPPELLLDDAERAKVLALEDQIYQVAPEAAGVIAGDSFTEIFEVKNIRSFTRVLVGFKRIAPVALLTDEAKAVAAERGFAQLANANSLEEVKVALLACEDKDVFNDLETISSRYIQDALTTAVLKGEPIEDIERVTVARKPEVIPVKLRKMFAYKDYLKAVKENIGINDELSDNAKEAARAIVKAYQKYINGQIADMYPDILEYIHFCNSANLPADLAKELGDYSMRVERIYKFTRARDLVVASKRFDGIRNGRDYDEHGKPTPFVNDLDDHITKANSRLVEPEQAVFTQEEIEALSAAILTASDVKDLLETVLNQWGLLSGEPGDTYDKKRVGRAKDKLWQVVVDNAKSLAVDGDKGIIRVPENYEQYATIDGTPYGAIPVVGHELTHVVQGTNASNNTGLHIGRDIKGRGYLGLREAGGIQREREVQERLFGRKRGTAGTYLSALRAVESGGNMYAAAKAFFDALHQGQTGISDEKLATTASNRALRLFRHGGYDSQPLDYMESAVVDNVTAHLPQEIRDYLYSEAGLSLIDTASLYKFGLLGGTDQFKSERSYEEIAEQWIRTRLLTK